MAVMNVLKEDVAALNGSQARMALMFLLEGYSLKDALGYGKDYFVELHGRWPPHRRASPSSTSLADKPMIEATIPWLNGIIARLKQKGESNETDY